MEHLSNSKELFRSLVKSISLPESREEVESIALLLLEKRFGLTREQIMAGKEISTTHHDLAEDVRRINAHEPVQYVVGVADFFGREFIVNRSVLIPRPETESLVEEALKFLRRQARVQRVLDVGTGSGCIAITLNLESRCEITAIDISDDALQVAAINTQRLQAQVSFKRHDILGSDPFDGLWDLIVSNPPYVSKSEAEQMKANVTSNEPHIALFVPDNDPLIFYRVLASVGRRHLRKDGAIIVELNEARGNETRDMFAAEGYRPSLINDLSGKQRVLVAKI